MKVHNSRVMSFHSERREPWRIIYRWFYTAGQIHQSMIGLGCWSLFGLLQDVSLHKDLASTKCAASIEKGLWRPPNPDSTTLDWNNLDILVPWEWNTPMIMYPRPTEQHVKDRVCVHYMKMTRHTEWADRYVQWYHPCCLTASWWHWWNVGNGSQTWTSITWWFIKINFRTNLEMGVYYLWLCLRTSKITKKKMIIFGL